MLLIIGLALLIVGILLSALTVSPAINQVGHVSVVIGSIVLLIWVVLSLSNQI